ncbi:MAG: SRPBCC family protein [Micromonosporaceae bacterium]|nr:SRPBCC family protein [Micromonosporaceae bacterium]
MRGAHSTIEVARLVRAPVERVWQVFTDLPARAEVMSTVDAVEILSDGTFKVGAAWQETRTLRAGPVTEQLRVVSMERPHRCAIESHAADEDYRMEYEFTPRNGHTRMWVRFDASPQPLANRVLAAFFGGMVARVIEGALRQDLEDLAAASESAAA